MTWCPSGSGRAFKLFFLAPALAQHESWNSDRSAERGDNKCAQAVLQGGERGFYGGKSCAQVGFCCRLFVDDGMLTAAALAFPLSAPADEESIVGFGV